MIDYDRTLSVLGVDANKLSRGSSKRVFAVCEECGKYRNVIYRAYHDLCKSCATIGEKNHGFGKHLSEEHREHIRKANSGKAHWNFGKHHTKETKKKISEAHKDKHLSKEHKQKISKSGKGRKVSKETREKISESQKGRKLTAEQCERMSEARRGENSPNYGIPRSEETRRRASATQQGISYDEWESYVCKQKYCPKFNDVCRESNREKYGKKCFICGLPESENFDKNGKQRKLAVHHVDCNKQQGCNGIRWKLIPVCMKHHTHNKLWTARIIYLLDTVWSN